MVVTHGHFRLFLESEIVNLTQFKNKTPNTKNLNQRPRNAILRPLVCWNDEGAGMRRNARREGLRGLIFAGADGVSLMDGAGHFVLEGGAGGEGVEAVVDGIGEEEPGTPVVIHIVVLGHGGCLTEAV